MFWFGYNVFFAMGFLLLLPRFLWRMWRRGGYRRGFSQRFGIYDRALRERLGRSRRVWVHAVSVGEVYVALRFMEEIRARLPEVAFVLTVTTSTGHALAAGRLDARDELLYFPVDFPTVTRRVLSRLRPRAIVLAEGEFWPNLVRLAHKQGIPVAVINGIISDRSYRGYRRLAPVARAVLGAIDLFLVQGRQDADRLVALGARRERVHVAGPAKYDVVRSGCGRAGDAQGVLSRAGIGPECRVLLGGSTWAGEEAALCEVYKALRPDHEDLVLVLVPRHAERRVQVAADVRKAGLRAVLRSRMPETPDAREVRPDVLIVDTTGELKHFYARATVVFVGKSLTQHGGQNIMEPALEAKPILVGPNMENFPDVMRDFREADAVIQVASVAELESEIGRLLQDAALGARYGKRAAGVIESKAGAVAASVERMLPLLRG